MLGDPPSGAEAGAVPDAAWGDDGGDALGPKLLAVAAVVVATVGVEPLQSLPGPTPDAPDLGNGPLRRVRFPASDTPSSLAASIPTGTSSA